MHGGVVAVASPGKNQGTTVTVVLPIRPLPMPHAKRDLDPPPVARHPAPQAAASLEGVSVLIVDDEEDIRDLLTLILEDHGAKVTAVPSAAAALDCIKQRLPDVLVSDIGMEEVDGHAFLRTLRSFDAEHGGQIPAVALTAYVTPADSAKALAAGFNHHLRKPVTPAEIVDVVATITGRRCLEIGQEAADS